MAGQFGQNVNKAEKPSPLYTRCPIPSIFRQNRQVLLEFANIANFEAQNRGNSAIGDTSPAHNFHRQREAQNRGFGEKSPEMLTLLIVEVSK